MSGRAAQFLRNWPGTLTGAETATELMWLWNHLEPARFPVTLGGMGFASEAPLQQDEVRVGWLEYGALADAISQRRWPSRITFDGRRDRRPCFKGMVGRVVGIADEAGSSDPIEALLRAYVRLARGGAKAPERGPLPLFRVVSFEGEAFTASVSSSSALSPRGALERWAVLEPGRFEFSDRGPKAILYRDTGAHVFAPVQKAMIAMQYAPALAVFDGVIERSWDLELDFDPARVPASRFHCAIRMPSGFVGRAAGNTVAPPCVEAYLAALEMREIA